MPVLPVFAWLSSAGGVSEAEMLRTFNCGVGMVLVAAAAEAEAIVAALRAAGEEPIALGRIIEASGERVAFTGRLAL
jgi:phosphoribosylformylglycinamidine cyclo-ligase